MITFSRGSTNSSREMENHVGILGMEVYFPALSVPSAQPTRLGEKKFVAEEVSGGTTGFSIFFTGCVQY